MHWYHLKSKSVTHRISTRRWMVFAWLPEQKSTHDLRSCLGGAVKMANTCSIVRSAMVVGLTATVALLTGLPAASADELADLRANQELLQRRIDQLAQAQIPAPGGAPGGGIPGAMGAEPIPGQSIVGGSFPRSFLIPGTDTSIRIGGFVD